MFVIPAIDLICGKVVRLTQGDFSKCKIYSEKPASVAKSFEEKGAKFLHIIDLEGAKEGKIKNLESIKKILKSVKIPIQVGGGIRNLKDAEKLLNIGVERIIVGTESLNQEFLQELISRFGEKIVVSIDAEKEKLAVRGWEKITSISIFEFAKKIEKMKVKRIIYTDIKKDGTLSGCNIEGIEKMVKSVCIPVIASGGISSLSDIKKLKKLNLEGIIIGKAIYEGKLSLEEAIEEGEK